MNTNLIKCIVVLSAVALLLGCDSKTTNLKIEMAQRERIIERLESENKRLIIKQSPLHLLQKTGIQKPNQAPKMDVDRGFQVVEIFMKQADNVDSYENYEFIGTLVKNIDPLDNKRNIELLQLICREYTPTDYKYGGLACEKLRLYEMALLPEIERETMSRGPSPLLKLFE
jgi:hypothetical protein